MDDGKSGENDPKLMLRFGLVFFAIIGLVIFFRIFTSDTQYPDIIGEFVE
ncbi:MAG: hypothetical protein ACJZ59_03970 [Candidatus Thalassarchaeaceae archaeon]|tara:strand:+ start:406 stop:555 length:150 start_codon:yes stop_codon:yes gene_type:complete